MSRFNKYSPSRIGTYTQAIVKPVFKARGLMEGKIITHWERIVGERIANLAIPEKITFPKGQKAEGTLHLSVTSSGSLYLHYCQGVILEYVNTFFGYKAIAKLRMSHGFTPRKIEPAKVVQPLSPEEKVWLEKQLEEVTDPDLKGYLENLGRSMCGDGLLHKTPRRGVIPAEAGTQETV